jgi:transposase
MIRVSKLCTKFTNKSKKDKLELFIQSYKIVTQDYINILWNNLTNNYECPQFVSTTTYANSPLSQRAIKCASTQSCGMIKAATEQARKLIWAINKLKESNLDTSYLEQQLSELKVVKPTLPNNFKCEINSICCDLLQKQGFWFLQLKCIGKEFGKIRIPLKPHRQTHKWKYIGEIKNSFLISNHFIDIRFEVKNEIKETGITLGLDQGITNCITLSDGQASKYNEHGWNLSKILKKKWNNSRRIYMRLKRKRNTYIRLQA